MAIIHFINVMFEFMYSTIGALLRWTVQPAAERSAEASVSSNACSTLRSGRPAAGAIAGLLIVGDGMSPWLALALVYLMTVLFTEVITNNAAAVLMFPIAMAVSEQLGVSYMPFVIAVMFAASASFMTPLGYQTNLMVYGPGRYRFTDYLKIGAPLSLLVACTSITLIPLVWGF